MITLAGEVLLDLLSTETRDWVSGLGQRRSFANGELIHSRGDRVVSMGIVISGRVRLVRLHADGSQTFVSTLIAGQHFGDVLLLAKRKRTHDALADGPAEIDEYDPDGFAKLLTNKEVLEAMYRVTALRLTGTMAMNDDLRSLPRDVHLAKILQALWRQAGGRDAIECTQEDLAALLGTSTMTLAKSLAGLRAAGMIETGYRRIRIADPERLRTWLKERT